MDVFEGEMLWNKMLSSYFNYIHSCHIEEDVLSGMCYDVRPFQKGSIQQLYIITWHILYSPDLWVSHGKLPEQLFSECSISQGCWVRCPSNV